MSISKTLEMLSNFSLNSLTCVLDWILSFIEINWIVQWLMIIAELFYFYVYYISVWHRLFFVTGVYVMASTIFLFSWYLLLLLPFVLVLKCTVICRTTSGNKINKFVFNNLHLGWSILLLFHRYTLLRSIHLDFLIL